MIDSPSGVGDDRGKPGSPPLSPPSSKMFTSPKFAVTPPPRARTRCRTLSPKVSRCANNTVSPSPVNEPKRSPPVTKSNTVVAYDDSGCSTYTSIRKQPQSPKLDRVQSVPQSPLSGLRSSGVSSAASPLASCRSVSASGNSNGLHRVGIAGANDSWSLKRWAMCCFSRRLSNYPAARSTIGVSHQLNVAATFAVAQ